MSLILVAKRRKGRKVAYRLHFQNGRHLASIRPEQPMLALTMAHSPELHDTLRRVLQEVEAPPPDGIRKEAIKARALLRRIETEYAFEEHLWEIP